MRNILSVEIKRRYNTKDLRQILQNMSDAVMRVGWNKNQMEPDNKTRTALVAYMNEVGYWVRPKKGNPFHVPARPMMGLTQEEYGNAWYSNWRRLVREYLAGRKDSFSTICKDFCKFVIADIRFMVEIEKPFAPNAPSTIKRKKSDTPLIDSKTMLNSLTYEVIFNK